MHTGNGSLPILSILLLSFLNIIVSSQEFPTLYLTDIFKYSCYLFLLTRQGMSIHENLQNPRTTNMTSYVLENALI